jgi:Domain of unknown function (DUF4440)
MRDVPARFVIVLMVAALSTGCTRPSVKDATTAEADVSPELGHRPDSATERAILQARDAIWRAWFANDTARLRHLVPEALAAGATEGSHERWSDRAQAMNEARQFVAAGGTLLKLAFPETEIHVMGDLAVVLSVYNVQVATRRSPRVIRGHSTEIFVLRDGQWVNPFWHLESSS